MFGRQFLFALRQHKFEVMPLCQHSCSVMVSSPVEGGTNQGSNPGGIKKIPSLATQKIVAGCWPVVPVVGLGPPTKGDCSGL